MTSARLHEISDSQKQRRILQSHIDYTPKTEQNVMKVMDGTGGRYYDHRYP